MGVGHGGVERTCVVVDRQSVESLQPIALEHILRCLPVGLAAFYLVDIAVVVVRELIEPDVQHIVSCQVHNGNL